MAIDLHGKFYSFYFFNANTLNKHMIHKIVVI